MKYESAHAAEFVRASVMRSLAEKVGARGPAGALLLRRHGFHAALLADPYALVPLGAYLRFFEDAAALLEAPDLGWRLGEEIELAALGPIAFLLLAQPTLGAALDCLALHVGALQGGTSSRVGREGELAFVEYRVENPALWPRRQDSEYSIAAILALVRRLQGGESHPVELHFEHARPSRPPMGTSIPCRYGESANRIVFEAEALSRPLRVSGAEGWGRDLGAVLERHLTDLRLSPEAASVPEAARASIDAMLGPAAPRVDAVARRMNMAPRSLQRALSAAGTSFSALLEERRRALAERLLRAGVLTLEEIAHELGYADATAFIRAWRGWTGGTPRGRGKGRG